MKTFKKSLAVILTVLLLVSSVPALSITGVADWFGSIAIKASAASESGTHSNLSYTYDTSSNKLTITGSGAMAANPPWTNRYYQDCKTVEIGKDVTSICTEAFFGFRSLIEVVFESGGTEFLTIADKAFQSCDELRSFSVPARLVYIDEDAFAGDEFLSISVESGNPIFELADGALVDTTTNTLLRYPVQNTAVKSYAVPEGITRIANWAFYQNELETITFPSSLRSIGKRAFCYSYELTALPLNEGLVSIEEEAFEFAKKITSVTIPDSVTSLGNSCFGSVPVADQTMLETVVIGSGVETIPQGAFEYCAAMKNVTLGSNVSRIESYAFAYTSIENMVIPATVTDLQGSAFIASELTNLTVDVKNIPSSAFSYTGIQNLVIGDNVETIGIGAFSMNSKLETVSIGSGLQSIDGTIFLQCDALKKVAFADGVSVALNAAMFSQCNDLRLLAIPAGVSTVPNGLLNECDTSRLTVLCDPDSAAQRYAENNNLFYQTGEATVGEGTAKLKVRLQYNGLKNPYEGFLVKATNLTGNGTVYTCELNSYDWVWMKGLERGYEYRVDICSPAGVVFGSKNVSLYGVDEGVVLFDDLIPLVKVTAQLSSNQRPLGQSFTVEWYSTDTNELLATGTSTNLLATGMDVRAEVFLLGDYAVNYAPPGSTVFTVGEGDQTVDIPVSPNSSTAISANIVDEYGNPATDCKVVLTEIFNQYASRKTGDTYHGSFNLSSSSPEIKLTISKQNYQTFVFEGGVSAFNSLGTVQLQPYAGPKFPLNYVTDDGQPFLWNGGLNYTVSVNGEEIPNAYADESILQLPRQVQAGDVIRVKADDPSGKYEPAVLDYTALEELNAESVGLPVLTLTFVENDTLRVHVQNSGTFDVLVYRNNSLVYYGPADKATDYLPAGDYQLIVIEKHNLLGAVSNPNVLTNYGLVAGEDYYTADIHCYNGRNNPLNDLDVTAPKLKHTANLTVLEKDMSYLQSDRSSLRLGQDLMLTARFVLSPSFDYSSLNDAFVRFFVPPGFKQRGGASVNGKTVERVNTGEIVNTVSVPVEISADARQVTVRLFLQPTSLKTNEPLYFTACLIGLVNGSEMIIPIGSTQVLVEDMNFSVPSQTPNDKGFVRGETVPESKVNVYDGDVWIGTVTADKTGSFSKDLGELLRGDEEDITNHEIHLVVETPEGDTLISESKPMTHDQTTFEPASLTMTNVGDHGENVIVMDYDNPSELSSSYRFWPGVHPTITFEAEFKEADLNRADDVRVISYDSHGNPKEVVLNPTGGNSWVGSADYTANEVPKYVEVVYEDTQTGKTVSTPAGSCKPIIDPSGYVYEAVESERLSGVTATIWYSPYADGSDAVQWDGSEYDNQINPQITDDGGYFEWFVPEGFWQVRYSKSGYEDTATEWLPVPPPQLDLHIPMVTSEAPAVEYIKAYPEYVEVAFTQYMNTNMHVSVYNLVDGDVDYLSLRRDAVDPISDPLNEGVSYAKVFRLVPAQDFTSTVRVWGMEDYIKNYAGIQIPSFDTVDVVVEARPESISGDGFVSLGYGETYEMTLSVLPAEAGANQTINVSTFAPSIASASAQTLTTDENGQATVTLTGNLPGITEFTFSLAQSTIELTTNVQVRNIGEEACRHENTEIRDAVPASCGVVGYSGDTYCLDCGMKLDTGNDLPALTHEFRTMSFTESCTEPCFGATGEDAYMLKYFTSYTFQYCIHCHTDKVLGSGGWDYTSSFHTTYNITFEIVSPPKNHADAVDVICTDDTSALSCADEPVCLPESYSGTAYKYCHDCDTLLVDDGTGNFVPVEAGDQALDDLVMVSHDYVEYPGAVSCTSPYVVVNYVGSDWVSYLVETGSLKVKICSRCDRDQIIDNGADKTDEYHSNYTFTVSLAEPFNHGNAAYVDFLPTSAEGLPCQTTYLDLPEATANYKQCPTCGKLLKYEADGETFTVVDDDSPLYDALKVKEHTFVEAVKDGDICEEYAYTVSGGDTSMWDFYNNNYTVSVKYCTTCGNTRFFAGDTDSTWAVGYYRWNLIVTEPQHHADAYDLAFGDATVCGVYTLPAEYEEAGVSYRYCPICGKILKTENGETAAMAADDQIYDALQMVAHTYLNVTDYSTAPSCTSPYLEITGNDGKLIRRMIEDSDSDMTVCICTNCGNDQFLDGDYDETSSLHSYYDFAIALHPALNHANETVIGCTATCEASYLDAANAAEGVTWYYCPDCGRLRKVVDGEEDVIFEADDENAPIVHEPDAHHYEDGVCTVCGAEKPEEYDLSYGYSDDFYYIYPSGADAATGWQISDYITFHRNADGTFTIKLGGDVIDETHPYYDAFVSWIMAPGAQPAHDFEPIYIGETCLGAYLDTSELEAEDLAEVNAMAPITLCANTVVFLLGSGDDAYEVNFVSDPELFATLYSLLNPPAEHTDEANSDGFCDVCDQPICQHENQMTLSTSPSCYDKWLEISAFMGEASVEATYCPDCGRITVNAGGETVTYTKAMLVFNGMVLKDPVDHFDGDGDGYCDNCWTQMDSTSECDHDFMPVYLGATCAGIYLDPAVFEPEEEGDVYDGPSLEQLGAMGTWAFCPMCETFFLSAGDDSRFIAPGDEGYDDLYAILSDADEHTDTDDDGICDVCSKCTHKDLVPAAIEETCASPWLSATPEALEALEVESLAELELLYCPTCGNFLVEITEEVEGEEPYTYYMTFSTDELAAIGITINDPIDHIDEDVNGACDRCGTAMAIPCTHEDTVRFYVGATCKGPYFDPALYDGEEPYDGFELEDLKDGEPIYYCKDCGAFLFTNGEEQFVVDYNNDYETYTMLTAIVSWQADPHTDVDPQDNLCDVCGACCHNTALLLPTAETCQSVWLSMDDETFAMYAAEFGFESLDDFGVMFCPDCGIYIALDETLTAEEMEDVGFTINQPSDHKDDNEDGKCDFCGISLVPECTHETLILTEAKAATCQTAGNSAYWTCDDCGLYFSDENAENEIAEGAWVLAIDPDAHNFGGTAVSNNDGTHSYPCQNEGCTEVGTVVDGVQTANGTENCDYGDAYIKVDETNHKQVCAACGYEVVSAHNFDETVAGNVITVVPNCMNPGSKTVKCANCDATSVTTYEPDPNNHDFSVYVETVAPTCQTGGYDTYKCSRCDATTQKNATAIDPAAHDFSVYVETVAPTCQTGGYDIYKCSRCDATTQKNETAIDPDAHDFSVYVETVAPTCQTGGYDTYKCSRCDATTQKNETAIDPAAHDFSVYVETVAPTCQTGGYDIYKCSRCDATTQKNETAIDPDAHDFSEFVETVDPTCQTGGYDTYKCSRCDATTQKNETAVDPDAHDFSVYVETVAPTCQTGGYDTYKCSRCDATTQKNETAVDPDAHDFSVYVETVAPTCQTGGYDTYKCSRCDATTQKNETAIDPNAHDFSVFVETVAATCTAGGYDTYKCSRCDATTQKNETAIDPDAHDFSVYVETVAPTCQTGGYDIYKCSRCDATTQKNETAVDPDAHDFSVYVETVAATCTAGGYDTYKCSRCDATTQKNETAVDPDAHDFSEFVETVAATCQTGGYDTYKCSRCDATTQKNETAIDPDAHDFSTFVETAAPTCQAGGYDIYKCSRCDATTQKNERAIDPDAHISGQPAKENEVPSTCKVLGGYDMVTRCTRCGNVLATEHVAYTEYAAHSYGDWTTVTASTCKTAGTAEKTCSVCGDKQTKTLALDANNHEGPTEKVGVKAATCTEKGYSGDVKCTACGEIVSRGAETAKKSHAMGEWTVTKEASCQEEGSKTRTCGVCGYTETQKIEKTGHSFSNGVCSVCGETEPQNKKTSFWIALIELIMIVVHFFCRLFHR